MDVIDPHIAYFQTILFEHRQKALLHLETAVIASDRDGALDWCGTGRFALRHFDNLDAAFASQIARRRSHDRAVDDAQFSRVGDVLRGDDGSHVISAYCTTSCWTRNA
jgi:hypothetical protein